MKLAVSGKGGVGKTLIAAGLARFFYLKGMKTIAIDADPSPNLALTLGLSVDEARSILPISENKELVESKTGTGYSGVYRLTFAVDDVVRDYSIRTPFGVNLVVMGTVRSMGSGCSCAANAVIRALIRHLVAERTEVVVLDMEAGVEHIGRGTAKHVDTMLVVTDANVKSLEIAKHIYELSTHTQIKQTFLVGNKIMNASQQDVISRYAEKHGFATLGFVPFDQEVVEAEIGGKSPLKLLRSEALDAISRLGEKLTPEESNSPS